MAMDSLQLSNESFSYSWMINIKPSFDTIEDGHGRHSSFDAYDSSSFIEMDPEFISMRWSSDANDFDFRVPSTQSSSLLVHADEIFSNGLILPLHFTTTPPKSEAVPNSPDQVFSRSLSVDSSRTMLSRSNRYHQHCMAQNSPSSWSVFHTAQSTPFSLSSCSPKCSTPSRNLKLKVPFFGTSVKSPKKVLRKYLFFLTPLYKKVKGFRSSSSKSMRSGGSTSTSSPRTSNASSSIELCRGSAIFDMGAENRIYDAVLHCKKSFVSSMA